MNLSDFITVYNATTNVKKHNCPTTNNLSLGDKIVKGEIVCKTYKYYESDYKPTIYCKIIKN